VCNRAPDLLFERLEQSGRDDEDDRPESVQTRRTPTSRAGVREDLEPVGRGSDDDQPAPMENVPSGTGSFLAASSAVRCASPRTGKDTRPFSGP
jgi:hypothetical protein